MSDPLVPAEFAAHVASLTPTDLEVGQPYAVSGAEWLRRLPHLLDNLLGEWGLTPSGPSRSGNCAVVVPVRTDAGPAALKVSWPHAEAATEHLALRQWDGRGAVRLLRADPRRFALLLERLDPSDLMDVEIDEACRVIGGLLAQLSSPAIPRTPTLGAYAARLLTSLDAAAPDALPRRFVDQARHLARDLAGDLASEPSGRPGTTARLLHTDLHYANVLRADRQGWLAIDPKPMAGDPAFEVAPALWNRFGELGTGSSIRWGLRRRLEVICEAAGIDEDRARAWTIVREVDNAFAEPPGSDGVRVAVAIIKAMND